MRSAIRDFDECLKDKDMFNLDFTGSLFTWTNNKLPPHIILRILDKAVVNDKWLNMFPNSEPVFLS